MRYLIVLLLAGCTHTITLYPRGGGETATGTVNDGTTNMEVVLRGDTYTGSYVKGRTSGVMIGGFGGTMGSAAMIGSSNQATALLTGPKGVLRCDFMIQEARGGNGVCLDSQNTVYDMLIK